MRLSRRVEDVEARVEELERRAARGTFHVVKSGELGVNLSEQEVARRCAAIREEHGEHAVIFVIHYDEEVCGERE